MLFIMTSSPFVKLLLALCFQSLLFFDIEGSNAGSGSLLPHCSDEKGCNCPNDTFTCGCYKTGCPSRNGCVKNSKRCDGRNDCGDRSDERDCLCSETKFQCKDGDCIDRSKVNDGMIDCTTGDDEFICNNTDSHAQCGCLNTDDQCTSSGRCILKSWIGDIIFDCEQHDDEPCDATKLWCGDCWITKHRCMTNQDKAILLRNSPEKSTRCHSLFIPSEQTRKLETAWICMKSPCGKCLNMFQCKNGQVIENAHYCDKTRQCNDGSDEYEALFGFRCSGKSRTNKCVLPQKNVYDSVAQCADRSDLCFVKEEFRCFSCLDGRLIVSANQVCDGIVDCYDMSDECLCQNQSVCNAVLGEETFRCPSHQMHCYNGTDCLDMDKVLCNSSVECESRRNRLFCHQHQLSDNRIRCIARNATGHLRVVNAARCDGRPECGHMEDECHCEHRPWFCDGACASEARRWRYGNRVCDGNEGWVFASPCKQGEINCSMRFYCKSKDMVSIDKLQVCDGVFDCDDQSDENNINCFEKRFYCLKGNAVSINKDFVCDGIKDCDNGEDEALVLCEEKRFYCDSERPISVDKKSVGNGIKDCSDGSDECISIFSNRYEMISNPMLRATFWIMGLLALIGNIIINFRTAKKVFYKRCNILKHVNNIFILNLTVSDFLMGVYLIAVVAQGKRFSGFYCFVDKEWRSSKVCSGLGTLALVSSEASAFIMTAMSTLRLFTIYKPFLSSSVKIKWIVIAGCCCWILSIFLAILPLFPFDSGYFISDVWFPNTLLKTDTVSKIEMIDLANRVSGDNSDHKSWFKIKDIISDTFKYNPIKGEFGYYGETSVCMPRIYTSTREAGWQYSTFLITLNFVLFLYMIVAYVLVYKSVSGLKPSMPDGKDSNKALQKRITRLLLTDFCCWIPVCVMGYLRIAGVTLPPISYILSAGFLFPINSAMNPIIYSKFFGRCLSRTKKRIVLIVSPICSCSIDQDQNVIAEHIVTSSKRQQESNFKNSHYQETCMKQ